jgi:hypothetical protein
MNYLFNVGGSNQMMGTENKATPVGNTSEFKCKSCGKNRNLFESVHIDSKLCVDCFNKRIVFEDINKKIEYLVTILKERNMYTPLRRRRIHHFRTLAEMLVPISIFDISEEQLRLKLDELYAQPEISLLKLRHGVSFIHYTTPDKFDFYYLFLAWKKYRTRIQKFNDHKLKFAHFIQFVGDKSEFKTLKDMMVNAIVEYINTYYKPECDSLKNMMFKQIDEQEPNAVYPNVAKYLYENYEKIYYRFFSEYLPFDKSNLTIDSPKAISRTDVAVKITYVFDNKDLTVIRKELKRKNSTYKLSSVCGWVLICSIKAFNTIITDILNMFHKKMKIPTAVTYATNIADFKIKETQKFVEVMYRITCRDN